MYSCVSSAHLRKAKALDKPAILTRNDRMGQGADTQGD